MDAAHQWLHATTGRIATCPHSWMQAVHWTAGSGLYTSPHADGPRAMNETTLAIAQEIAALAECRPGITYLARKTKVSERSVKYHLRMLRETGLLAYRSKGTRVRGEGNQASVFERIIPVVFDHALGIRTVGEGVQRRPVGIAEKGRTLIGKLARKAARKTRRRPHRTPSSRQQRCTPMQVGTSGTSSADRTYSPPESKLASGQEKSQHPKKAKRGQRTLNKIGRRYQLGRQATTVIPWLHGAAVPRISWVLAEFADAGWTVREVQAVAESIPLPAFGVKRPSGMLADRLRGKAGMTKTMRAAYVAMWEESRVAAKDRHIGYDDLGPGPKSLAARRAWDEAFEAIRGHLAPEMPETELPPLGSIDDLTRQEVIDLRAEAMERPEVVLDMIQALGERDARRLYTNRLVDQTLALENIAARNADFAPAF
ncbi:transcriptional regulator [Streptomyces bottropensis]|uniref:transcriptional regulator n=1 Tax=Streptomyces bottropensis TaxID=42235 RepID=UPI0036D0C5B9